MTQSATQVFFDAAIDLLLAAGNRIYGNKRWHWDKEGGHCTLCRPIDFALLERELAIPSNVLCDPRQQTVATQEEYFELHYELPHGDTPPYETGQEPARYSWSPFWLVHTDGARQESFVDRAFEFARRELNARVMTHTRPHDNRYVDTYWSSLRNSVLEFYLHEFPTQSVWLSRWRFFNPHLRFNHYASDVEFILPGITAERPEIQRALLPIATHVARHSGLYVWDHQEQRLLSG
jgi:hypothetical protein